MVEAISRPKVAVWKFASCDGCQLSLLSAEDELLTIAGEVQIAYFLEATREVVGEAFDVAVEVNSFPDGRVRVTRIAELGGADAKGIVGKAVTPFLLGRIVELSGGRSLAVNLDLVRNNIKVAAAIATAYAG